MKDNILKDKTIKFSVRIIKLSEYLNNKKAFILSNQILRSGTSIGANVNEAVYAQSKADFISKLQIALKETSETEYWLTLLKESGYIDANMYSSLVKDCLDIKKLLISSVNTSKKTI